MGEAKRRKERLERLMGRLDENELAVRMIRAIFGPHLPMGSSPKAVLARLDPELRDGWKRAARAAFEYCGEVIRDDLSEIN